MARHRKSLLLFPFILLLTISCPSAKRNFLNKEEIAWLRQNGEKVQVLFGYEAPPDAFTNSLGTYDGLLVDYFREIEATLHMSIPMKIFPSWIDIMDYSREGKDYIIFGIIETEQRDEYLLFTDPFYKHQFSIITLPESDIETLSDLEKKRFAVVNGYAITELLAEDYPALDPIPVENDLIGLRAVAEGEIDAFVTFKLYGIYVAETQGIKDLRMTPLSEYNVEYRIAVSRSDVILRSIMEKTLKQISNRRKRELDLRWNSLSTTRISTRLKGILFSSLAAFILITAVVFFWLFLLRKEVNRKTKIISESEKKFRRLAQNRHALILSIPDAMAIADEGSRIIETNDILSHMLDQTEEEMKGKRVSEILPFKSPSDYLNLKNMAERMLSGASSVLSFNAAILTKNEKEIILSISGAPIISEGDTRLGEIWILKDITGQRIIENEVLESRKLDTLAVLAGGIAHDFNNLLTGLYGYIDLSLLTLDDREAVKENLNRALNSLDNAKKLTAQMLSFSRGGDAKKEIINPSNFLPETAEFSLHGRNITLTMDFEENLPSLYADRGQLSQVISNLVINAGQAMKNYGEIRISAFREKREDRTFLRISVKDTGPGIPPDIQKEIFKPYFTTKTEGNGLGLASCRTIIENHNGTIGLVSSPGEGAEFIITLPVYETGERERPDEVPLLMKDTAMLEETALVLEKNKDIRLIMNHFLGEMGFTVQNASTAGEALNLYTQSMDRRRPFGLVLVDIAFDHEPCLNSLAQRIRRINRNAVVMATSGSLDREELITPEKCAYSGILLKPFSFADFSSAVKQAVSKESDKT